MVDLVHGSHGTNKTAKSHGSTVPEHHGSKTVAETERVAAGSKAVEAKEGAAKAGDVAPQVSASGSATPEQDAWCHSVLDVDPATAASGVGGGMIGTALTYGIEAGLGRTKPFSGSLDDPASVGGAVVAMGESGVESGIGVGLAGSAMKGMEDGAGAVGVGVVVGFLDGVQVLTGETDSATGKPMTAGGGITDTAEQTALGYAESKAGNLVGSKVENALKPVTDLPGEADEALAAEGETATEGLEAGAVGAGEAVEEGAVVSGTEAAVEGGVEVAAEVGTDAAIALAAGELGIEGAALGSAAGPIGTAVGLVVGAAVGVVGYELLHTKEGKKITKAIGEGVDVGIKEVGKGIDAVEKQMSKTKTGKKIVDGVHEAEGKAGKGLKIAAGGVAKGLDEATKGVNEGLAKAAAGAKTAEHKVEEGLKDVGSKISGLFHKKKKH